MWIIYAHRNKINNKYYIGQTTRTIAARSNGGKGYIDSPKFYAAIQKYGWNNFEHIILENNIPTQELANEKENFWINYYDSCNNGYNIIQDNILNHSRGDAYNKSISIGRKKYWEEHPDMKKQYSDYYKNKWSDPVFRENHSGKNNGRARKVICLDNNMIFDTINEAALWANTSRQNITGVLNKRQNTAGGYRWSYYNKKDE